MPDNKKVVPNSIDDLEDGISQDEIDSLIEEFEDKVTILMDAGDCRGCSSTSMYLASIAATQPITGSEKRRIIRSMNLISDKNSEDYRTLRNIVVQSDLKLVASIAFKSTGHGIQLEDLISEGTIGLIKAVEKYDPDGPTELTTYAYKWIKLYIDLAIQKNGSMIAIPMWIRIKLIRMACEENRISHEKGIDPLTVSNEDLAAALSWDVDEIKELRSIRYNNVTLSVDKLAEADENDDKKKFEPEDPSANISDIIAAEDTRASWIKIINQLPTKKYRDVIKMRYGLVTGDSMSCAEVARYYQSLGCTRGITRESIRQIEEKALAILRSDEFKAKLKEEGLC